MGIGNRVGHIRLERLLGSGGMGEVYRGFDEKLERPVAVKTLRAERRLRPEAKARFLREARLLSRLDHPGICRVFDLVEEEDADHLVLELVEGRTLAAALTASPTADEVLRLFEQIADALAVAHGEHIVHRDLKPENVMVTPEGGVKVLDFGIARSLGPQVVAAPGPALRSDAPATPEAASLQRDWELDRTATMAAGQGNDASPADAASTLLTADGSVVGTVRYMSPEQAAGDEVTEASDMYSFGVMLQEALTRAPAYGDAQGMELLLKVYRAETVPPTGVDPEVAPLLDRLRAVDPAARPAAADTADRLRFILDRPLRARRRRVRLAVVGAVVAAVLVAAGFAVHARLSAARRVAVAQRFAQQAERVEWLLRAERLSPPHDIRPGRAQARALVENLAARLEREGDVARGAAFASLGRGWLALGELDRARASLDAAWAAGERSPEVAYALGVTYGGLYSRRLARARTLGEAAARDAEIASARRELRDPALQYLRSSTGATGVAPAYVEGLLAQYEERYEEGLRAVEAAAGAAPWYHELDLQAGELAMLWAKQASTEDRDLTRARALQERSAIAFRRASEIARSDALAGQRLCEVQVRLLESRLEDRDVDLAPSDFDAVRDACDRALALDPGMGRTHLLLGGLGVLEARLASWKGGDPLPLLEQAAAAVDRAVELEPEDPAFRAFSTWVRTWQGVLQEAAGADPRPVLRRALADGEAALRVLPGDPTPEQTVGDVCQNLATAMWGRGEDPSQTLDRGVEVMRSATARWPDNTSMWVTMADLLELKARYELARGRDSEALLSSALEARHTVVERSRGPDELRLLAQTELRAGVERLSRGADGGELLARAVAHADEAARLGPGFASPLLVKAGALVAIAEHAAARGEDPDGAFVEATRAYSEALRVSAEAPEALVEMATAHLAHAHWRVLRGAGPEPDLEAAERALERAPAAISALPPALAARASLDTLRGVWAALHDRSPEEAFARADSDLGRAVESNRAEATLHASVAEVALWRAWWRARRGESPKDDVEQGMAALSRALERNPRLARAEVIRAGLHEVEARAAPNAAAAAEARRLRDEARARALALNPLLERELDSLLAQLRR